MINTIHSIDVGNAKPFHSHLYHKFIVEEQTILKELISLLSAELLKLSKST